MMTTMPLQQEWQCQLEDGNNTIVTRATKLSWIKGNNAIVTRATMPAQQWQGRLRINNSNDTIVMRATIAIAMTAKMPVQLWQRHHHDKGGNASSTTSNEGNGASLTTAETPAYWGKDTIVTRVTIAIATMAKMSAHQWQWRHHNKGNHASLTTSDKGNDACVRTHANKHIICLYLHASLQAYQPCKPLLWANAQQISPSPCLPPLFCNICVQKLGSIVCAKTRKRQQQLCWCYNNELLVLVCTQFLCRIGFLSKTTLSQPSQQGKEGLDKDISTNSRARLSNCVCHWMHQGGGRLILQKRKGHIGSFGLATNLRLFFLRRFCILCVSHKISFFWQEMRIYE